MKKRVTIQPTVVRMQKTREALRAAVDHCCRARGEAMWTQGYRTRYEATMLQTEAAEAERLRLADKELAQFKACDAVERRMERALMAFARAVRRQAAARTRRTA